MRERLYVCFFIRWSVNSGRHQLASMTLLMPSGLSVECRNWMAVERFIQRILRSIFSSLHYSAPRYFTPCSFPPHQTKRFPSPNFSLCYLFFPPFFTAKKSPLLSFSSFIFCVLCHFYRSTLCVCVLKYILNLRYAQFHHLPTQDFWHWRRRADSSKRFPQSNGGAWRTSPKVFHIPILSFDIKTSVFMSQSSIQMSQPSIQMSQPSIQMSQQTIQVSQPSIEWYVESCRSS